MNRKMKRLLRERRRTIKVQLKQKRREIAELKRKARANRPPSKWRRRLLILLLLLLLLLLRPCTGEGPGSQKGVRPAQPLSKVLKEEPPPKAPPKRSRLKSRKRPRYEGGPANKKKWLDAFRLQVAGRSLRLSACFEGAERPGAVRWVSAVDPGSGKVSDHTLEPVASSMALSRRQRRCVIEVLSEPPYRLDPKDAAGTPERVGMVLEF